MGKQDESTHFNGITMVLKRSEFFGITGAYSRQRKQINRKEIFHLLELAVSIIPSLEIEFYVIDGNQELG